MKKFIQAVLDRTIKQRIAGSYAIYIFARRIIFAFENYDVEIESNGERWLQRAVIAANKSALIVGFDVGANRGDWVHGFLKPGVQSRIFCYEPIPNTFSMLEDAVKDRRAILINKAISGEVGELQFNSVIDNPHLSTIYDVDTYGEGHEVERVVVESTTGDIEIESFGLEHVNIVKVDAEGHDVEVIMGFRKSIAQDYIDIFQFEYNHFSLVAKRSLRDFYNILAEKYVICRLLPCGLEACGYHSSMDTFGQSNWVAVRKAILDDPTIRLLRVRPAKGLPGEALARSLSDEPELSVRLGCRII